MTQQQQVVIHRHPVPPSSFDESIYDLLPLEIALPEKPPRYQSKYANQARQLYKAGTKDAASMGPAKVPLAPPVEFVRKGEGLARFHPG
jgi:hypothetical protein